MRSLLTISIILFGALLVSCSHSRYQKNAAAEGLNGDKSCVTLGSGETPVAFCQLKPDNAAGYAGKLSFNVRKTKEGLLRGIVVESENIHEMSCTESESGIVNCSATDIKIPLSAALYKTPSLNAKVTLKQNDAEKSFNLDCVPD